MRILKSIMYSYLLNIFAFWGLCFGVPPLIGWYLKNVSESGSVFIMYLSIVIFIILTYLSGRIIAQNIRTYYLSACVGVYLLVLITCSFIWHVILFFFLYWLYILWFLSILVGCFITRYQINIKKKKAISMIKVPLDN